MNKKRMSTVRKKIIVALIAIAIITLACMQINFVVTGQEANSAIAMMGEDGHSLQRMSSADLAEGYDGAGYNDDHVIDNMATTTVDSCNNIANSHGLGRENGYSSTFLNTGCRQYKGYPSKYNYGISDIPYYINPESMSNTQMTAIRAQASLWNQAVMHDGTGQIVNLYEVSNANDINGRKVCQIILENLKNYDGNGRNAAGLFYSNSVTIKLSTDGYNIDTPMHEMGHLLGLKDLDVDDITSHQSIMAYQRGGKGISGKLQYQDIQGIALVNNRHTVHQYDRYVMKDGKYLHFCFYCDLVEDSYSVISNARAMAEASACDHMYQDMVSAGDRHWVKCLKCYKVVDNHEVTRLDAFIQTSATLSATNISLDFARYGRNAYVSKTFTVGAAVNQLYIKNMNSLKDVNFVFKGNTKIIMSRSNFKASENGIGFDARGVDIEIYNIGESFIFGGSRPYFSFVEAYGLAARAVTITGAADAVLFVTGGSGKSASGEQSHSVYMNGATGSIGMYVESLDIYNTTVAVIGGSGGSGYHGADSTALGGKGDTGGKGGNGAVGLRVTGNNFQLYYSTLYCQGGIGGGGGDGGKGGAGGKGTTGAAGANGAFLVAAKKGGTGGKGGSGGMGGAGGVGGSGAAAYVGVAIVGQYNQTHIDNGVGGTGGTGGDGGIGGTGGDGGQGGRKWNSTNYAAQGDSGAQGNTGAQGTHGADGVVA